MKINLSVNTARVPDDVKIICENGLSDTAVRFEITNGEMSVFLKAQEDKPKYILLRWNYRFLTPAKIMGDKWGRDYGDMEWHSLNGEIFMPWYFLINSGDETVGCGVKVQPNSFVSFQCDASGITAWLDVRNGGYGVELCGRELLAAVFVCEHYSGITPFAAAVEFCKVMSPKPRLPKLPVYGSNNWYYAYGESSFDEIVNDAKLLSELTRGNENRPFMVIDDGWEENTCAGPWLPNEKYGDMERVVAEFKRANVKPGIWIRLLHDLELEKNKELLINTKEKEFYLDPSNPAVKKYIKNTVERIRNWGFELLKHDYSIKDMFGKYGYDLNGRACAFDDVSFYDRTKTSAEIVLDFYRTIREAAGDMLIIGCDTFSHLSAGLFEIYRIGDDTSGKVWSRTRDLGVNSLGFRLCQNGSFYMADADCVGILDNNINWELNKQWLDLLAKSGTPLFVSAKPSSLTDEIKAALKEAFEINSVQKNTAEPLDWLYNNQPCRWLIDGKVTEYDFVLNSYPALIDSNIQPYS